MGFSCSVLVGFAHRVCARARVTGPGGTSSAQGHHGAAEDEPDLLWLGLGRDQEVHLRRLFPPGGEAEGAFRTCSSDALIHR